MPSVLSQTFQPEMQCGPWWNSGAKRKRRFLKHRFASRHSKSKSTDGKDIGADIATLLTKVSGVRSDTTYTAASITTS